MATANHNCVEDSPLLLAFGLGDNLPLARGREVRAFFHTEDSCLKQKQRRHHGELIWHHYRGLDQHPGSGDG